MQDFVVSRYSKAMTTIKLKDDDELINIAISKSNTMFISQNGYYLLINSNEIPLVGAKASGVKGINLKDDTLIKGLTFSDSAEYITIFTNNRTAKRIKISELTRLTRAKKGNLLIKKVKTNSYYVVNALAIQNKDIIDIKSDNEIKDIKATEIPIMDLTSTGSQISKYNIDDAFKKTELYNYLHQEKEISNELSKDTDTKSSIEELTIDDFIDEFKI